MITSPPQREYELALLIMRYCGAYRKIFGTPYWAGRRLARGEQNDALEREFQGVLLFFRDHKITVHEHLTPWQGYLEFALAHFKEKGIMPRPSSVKNYGLFQAYCINRPPTPEPVGEKVDYSKVLSPELRTPAMMKFLGLDEQTIERELRR